MLTMASIFYEQVRIHYLLNAIGKYWKTNATWFQTS